MPCECVIEWWLPSSKWKKAIKFIEKRHLSKEKTMSTVKTRFAPSPTGFLHIGGARTALLNWAFAKQNGGQFVLRIEDTDAARSTEESSKAILESMKWLGLDWDEGPIYQSDRKDIYAKAAHDLVGAGKAYKCFCTADELTLMRQKQESAGQKPKYDGRCEGRADQADLPFVIRFKTPKEGRVAWKDAVKGSISFPNVELDDLIILRSDGLPTYNFACVVDDATMGITHVIRGDDHVNNTPRQIHLYAALNHVLPIFAHAPMILGPDGERFSKRHGAESVLAYREAGILPEALLNFLARLSWGGDGKTEVFSKESFATQMSLKGISTHPSKYDANKLAWLGGEHLKLGGVERFWQVLPDQEKATILAQNTSEEETLKKLAIIWKPVVDRSKTVPEALGHLKDMSSAQEASNVVQLLPALYQAWGAADFEWTSEALSSSIKEASAQSGLKLGQAMMILRSLMYRSDKSLPLDAALIWMGKERAMDIAKSWITQPELAPAPVKPKL